MLFILNVQSVDDIGKLTQLFRKFLTKFFRITAIPGVKKAVLYIFPRVSGVLLPQAARHKQRTTASKRLAYFFRFFMRHFSRDQP